MKKCTLGLGCFWGPEENFKNKPGIVDTEVGYAGGHNPVVSYEEVCKGSTGHAEVVRLTFDEKIISFKKILDLFFKMHDPTQKDMQFPDIGTQYRSEIFYEDEDQKKEAKEVLEILNKKGFDIVCRCVLLINRNFFFQFHLFLIVLMLIKANSHK